MKIRKATKQDIKQIWKIENQERKAAESRDSKKFSDLNLNKTESKAKVNFIKGLANDLENQENILLVVEISKKIVGWIYAEIGTWSQDIQSKIMWIDDIGILDIPDRDILLSELLKEAERIASDLGINYCNISVDFSDQKKYRFLKRNNYEGYSIELLKKL